LGVYSELSWYDDLKEAENYSGYDDDNSECVSDVCDCRFNCSLRYKFLLISVMRLAYISFLMKYRFSSVFLLLMRLGKINGCKL
jgi:hypothetical protein